MGKLKESCTTHDDNERRTDSNISVARKVFFVPEEILRGESVIKIERFFHPGKDRTAFFLVESPNDNTRPKKLFEIMEFSEPRRAWITNRHICSNGKAYLTVPMDITFLALHYVRKFCSKKALSLNSITDDTDPNVFRLMNEYTTSDLLASIANVKKLDDLTFYKYNPSKTLAWLAIKVKKLEARIRREGIHSASSCFSQNYCKSEKDKNEMDVGEDDFLKAACQIVGNYLDLPLLSELTEYLGITELENETKTSENVKRKSLQNLNSTEAKKVKLHDTTDLPDIKTQKESSVIEQKVSAKSKALAKSAKGTKSIASFFKK